MTGTDWTADAACRAAVDAGTARPWFWWADGGAPAVMSPTLLKAQAICLLDCPVRTECLTEALAEQTWADHLILGGLSAKARRRIREGRRSIEHETAVVLARLDHRAAA